MGTRRTTKAAAGKTGSVSSDINESSNPDITKLCEKDGVSPALANLLVQIHTNTQETNKTVNEINQRFTSQDECITSIKTDMQTMSNRIDILAGRLVRAEQNNKRLSAELEQLKAHSMNSNLVITSPNCGESPDEKPIEVAHKFLKDELKIANPEKLYIPVAHRVGQKIEGKSRPIIIKVPESDDVNVIMKNVGKLKGSKSYVDRQIPASMQERRRMTIPSFKAAKQKGDKALLVRDKLFIKGTLQRQFLPPTLPDNTLPANELLNIAESKPIQDSGSIFQGYACEVHTLDDVRDALNQLLRNPNIASSTHVIYAYRCEAGDNFDSDGDWGIGYGLFKQMEDDNLDSKLFVVTRKCLPNFKHIGPKRILHSIAACSEANDKLESDEEEESDG